jgi:hypothetical protein
VSVLSSVHLRISEVSGCTKPSTANDTATVTLGPIVIEAQADTVLVGAIGGYFMLEPAFKKKHFAWLAAQIDVAPILIATLALSGRRPHESADPGILDLEAPGILRNAQIIGSADRGKRMKMKAMVSVLAHDVDPERGDPEPLSLKIHLKMLGEGLDLAIDRRLQCFKTTRTLVQVGNGGIGSVALDIVLTGPSSSLIIKLAERIAFAQKRCPALTRELWFRAPESGRKELLDRHDATFLQGPLGKFNNLSIDKEPDTFWSTAQCLYARKLQNRM